MPSPFVTPVQALQFYDKYSRYNHDLGRRETWDETVQRVMTFLRSQTDRYKVALPGQTWDLLEKAMRELRAMPSMRIVQMAGPALERCNVGAYNCLSGDEQFVTSGGIKSFAETVGTIQRVLCADGIWRDAEVSQFGEAPVNLVTLRPGSKSRTGLRKTVKATADHGWLTSRGRVRDLKVGDEVLAVGSQDPFSDEDWVVGFLFGDGTVQDGFTRVRLCGPKADYLDKFVRTGARVSYPERNGGDPAVSWERNKFAYCKQLPSFPSPSWMQGYLAADGGHQDRQPTLSTVRRDVVDYLQLHAAELGICVTGLTAWTKDSNFGPRQPLYKLGIRPAADVTWRVMSIEPTEGTVPVFCVTEPVTSSFTLANGLASLNCAYLPMDSWDAFGELLYVLMQGTGCGFSVEVDYVDSMPRIKRQRSERPHRYIVPDTTTGWCDALTKGLKFWANGEDIVYDFSRIRPQGTVLKTKGGRSSGPEPLKRLLTFAREKLLAHQGRRLDPVDAHDIACYCGDIVQVGGVRRAAEISLSDLDDREMRDAKAGQFWLNNVQRRMANNSAVYDARPSSPIFMEEWLALMKSGTGERGIFNRGGIVKNLPKRREKNTEFGINPCGEIILRPRQFCNLSIAIARPDDTEETLQTKVEIAAFFGTIQSLLTDFDYLPDEWRRNCEDERLLGVDITGQMDCPLLRPSSPGRNELLKRLRQAAVDTNQRIATEWGVSQSSSVTCVKPSGNSAQLFNCSSGLHPRYAKFYVRRLRIGAYTPIARLLKDSGIPFQPEIGETLETASVLVFEFPIKAPDGAPTRHDMTANQQLENWLDWKQCYTEHNPSVTIYVEDHEWPSVGAWVYEHFDQIGGLSFLPKDGGKYELAPYEEITEAEYAKLAKALPVIDFGKLPDYETSDMTEINREYACSGDKGCEI
jgi:ribonucleoside-triphosphate reductase